MDIQKDDRKACGKEQTGDRDWKVTFEGGFYGQRGRRGIEIPVGKTFSWGKEIWHVPAVYQCGKGLVADIFAEIDPERVRAFLELYRDLEEDRLTEEEQERIQQESPLETGFQPEIVLNGRKLRGVEGNGSAGSRNPAGKWMPGLWTMGRQKDIRNWIMTGIQWRIRQRRSTRRQTRMKRSGGSWSITDWIRRRPGP